MSKVLVIGSLNMDTVITVENLPKDGDTIIAKGVNKFCGGKGSNQAISLSRLGANTVMLGKLGNDENGVELINGLKSEGVDTEHIVIDNNKPTGSAFINVDQNGTNTIVVNPGANYSVDKDYIDEKLDSLKELDYCLLQYEIPIETIEYIIEKCFEKGIKVIVNPSPVADISEELYKKIYMLIVNENELYELSGIKTCDDESIKKAMNSLIDKGIKCIMATFGPRGSMYMDFNYKMEYHEAFIVNAIDTTGAGDAFTGAFVASLVRGGGIKESMKFANAAGALAVQVKGAQNSIPMLEDVERFIAERKI